MQSPVPCCRQPDPEAKLAGRCAFRAQANRCNESSIASFCPVACGLCVRCVGDCHTSTKHTSGARAGPPRRQSSSGGVPLAPFLADTAWCSTWPRCARYGCCTKCHRPQQLRAPLEPGPHAITLAGHPRTLEVQRRDSLAEALADLPFTTPEQHEQRAARRIVHQGARRPEQAELVVPARAQHAAPDAGRAGLARDRTQRLRHGRLRAEARERGLVCATAGPLALGVGGRAAR